MKKNRFLTSLFAAVLAGQAAHAQSAPSYSHHGTTSQAPWYGLGEIVDDRGRVQDTGSRVRDVGVLPALTLGSVYSLWFGNVNLFSGDTPGLYREGRCDRRASGDGTLGECVTPRRGRTERVNRRRVYTPFDYSDRVFDTSNTSENSRAMNFLRLNFSGSSFRGLRMNQLLAVGTNFTDATFDSSRLWNVRLLNVQALRARFVGGTQLIKSGSTGPSAGLSSQYVSRAGVYWPGAFVRRFVPEQSVDFTGAQFVPAAESPAGNLVRLFLAGGSVRDVTIRSVHPWSQLHLAGVDGRNVSTSGSTLNWSTYALSDLSGAQFNDVQMNASSMRNVRLDGAQFVGSQLNGLSVDYTPRFWPAEGDVGAYLEIRNVNFSDAELNWARFNLQGHVQLIENGQVATVLRTNASQLNFSRASLIQARFVGARPRTGPHIHNPDGYYTRVFHVFARSEVRDTNFTNADLSGSIFSDLVLANVDFTGSVLNGACFSNTDLSGSNLAAAASMSGATYTADSVLGLSQEVAAARGMTQVSNCRY
jgi:uncharacterized protein YjbI with pentapeptide repeats